MRLSKYLWMVGLIFILVVLLVPVLLFLPRREAKADDPWAHIPNRLPHTDHSALMEGPFEDGPSVTRACLECHPDADEQVMATAHWTWESEPVLMEGRIEPVAVGKKNAINNFCIGIQSNWPPCTACHAGYGWEDDSFDFSVSENVDCLVCHDHSGQYVKANGGYPAEGVDLLAAARSAGSPTRENCGGCHFRGGGGNAVKHGDLDESLYFPSERIDVHMGKHDFTCTDCHQTADHVMKGRSISVSVDDKNQAYCTDCHSEDLHEDERINAHVATVACQACHISTTAIDYPTKIHWDWSAAGQDLPEDPHEYLKIKGRFEYEEDLVPEYYWFNGTAGRYLLGDKIDPRQPTVLNPPLGDIDDPLAKIWPFKVHRAEQIYDAQYDHLLLPKTAGEGGFWTEFDWDKAVRLGSATVDLPYSGEYGFAPTEMYWPTTHMVSPVEQALQCNDCHSDDGRIDWESLGYDGDPVDFGGRDLSRVSETTPTGAKDQ